MRRAQKLPQAEYDIMPFNGGYDSDTPSWQIKPGLLKDAQNYEIGVNGGYQDIQGYERFDGQPRPSAAIYSILDVTITGEFSVGDTITQLVSGATGVIIAIVEAPATLATAGFTLLSLMNWIGGFGDGIVISSDYLVLTKTTGTFTDTNDLQVSAVTEGTSRSELKPNGAPTGVLHAQYLNLAADEYRSDITAVPGEDSVLGVWMLADVKYAFRNAVGGATAEMYKSTAAGWVLVPLGFELAFTSGGTTEIVEGDTLTGDTSTKTATLTRVMLESGSWAGGDAAGKFIFASASGAFQAEEVNSGLATIAGDATAITLLPDGDYEFYNFNFGIASDRRMYGVDGVNRGFEFDGTAFCPITTGMTTDSPSHVFVHKQHLFFSFEGSAQHSGIGTPYKWTVLSGAAELATGDTITGFQGEPGVQGSGALGIYGRHRISVLYGTSSADWNLVQYRDRVGAFEGTIQQSAYTMFLDDRGITSLQTVQQFGNVQHATLSTHIQSYINTKKLNTANSCVVRDKNQYRLFSNDGTGLYATLDGNNFAGFMPVTFEHPVTCVFSEEALNGAEEMYFGSDDGFVYQLDKGTSFDGTPIEALMTFHYHHMGSLGWLKRFTSTVLEVAGTGYAEFSFGYLLGYGDSTFGQGDVGESKAVGLSASLWDEFTWDSFTWDGQALLPCRFKLAGEAENISFLVRKSSDYMEPVLFTGARTRKLIRRQLR